MSTLKIRELRSRRVSYKWQSQQANNQRGKCQIVIRGARVWPGGGGSFSPVGGGQGEGSPAETVTLKLRYGSHQGASHVEVGGRWGDSSKNREYELVKRS